MDVYESQSKHPKKSQFYGESYMLTTNRVMDFYNHQKVVPYDEVNELMADAFKDGFADGYRNGLTLYRLLGVVCFVVGVLFGWVCS